MKIIPITYPKDTDELKANTYFICDSKDQVIIVDPSVKNDHLINFVNKNHYKCVGILLTHTHCDHMRGASLVSKYFDVPVYLGFDDKEGLTNNKYNCSLILNETLDTNFKHEYVCDNEQINLLNEPIICIYTPFHTLGSVSYYIPSINTVLSGDSLFKGSVGRTDLYSSNIKLMASSLKKLMSLPENTKVYPGHGCFTSIKEEKISNPFVK